MKVWLVNDMEAILDWQDRGITARILGYPPEQNPLLARPPERSDNKLQDWQQRLDAWSFGWAIEDASRG
jgi:hypothetical protein